MEKFRGVFNSVQETIESVSLAFKTYREFGISDREEIVREIRKELLKHVNVLAEKTIDEICMGDIASKKQKIKLAIERTPGTEDLYTEVITRDKVMTLYELSPYGIACAIQPSTNPCATVINNVIGLLSAGNGVIICPHPRAIETTKFLVSIISDIISKITGLDNLVVTLEDISMQNISEIMNHPDIDLVVVTGGSYIAKYANKCNKKVISAGPGNPTFIVDETADIEKAARNIVKGATFDNNILCVTEKNIVVVDDVYENLKSELIKNSVYYVDSIDEMLKLAKILLTEDLKPNKFVGGKSASDLLKMARIEVDKEYALIAVDVPKIHPFVTEELLVPLITIVKTKDFESALDEAIFIEQGLHHTAGIYSNIIERLNIAARKLQTSIFVKNGSSLDAIGFSDGNPVSFTIANISGEGAITTRHFARRRRCTLVDAFSIR
ncbi:aldehyde dehydrogenase [Peptoniphilus indolicus]|uniref:CoA-dependent propionaldehyde dehydrogenase n=2 Tax=Peptoniphilus indolicus TaxID=33030 RepID=G4D1U4_9FIRM|nr:aldehyde dehydrogenase [Peptoniphilus indolicus]EGY80504.1 CoA-dependent propionaldehyde dehydrogenase [Peptoniphilus indolicus ATCC 29427]SUB75541.1 Succinate-semialdehyde dehydrogenase (acetylating) [Peptoniphilus indolicus]